MKRLLPLLALLLLLPALAVAQEEPPVLCVAVYYRAGVLELVVIPCPGAEATPTPTRTSAPTATPTVTPSATPTPTATWTPFPTPTPEVLEYTPVPQPCYVQTNGGNTNVRSAPGTENPVLTILPGGTLFGVLGWDRDSTDGMWVRRLQGGWVARWVVYYRSGCNNDIIEAGP